MSSVTFLQTLAALTGRRPFRSFTIALDDGAELEIDQPHAVLVRNGVAVFLPANCKPIWFDHTSVTRIDDGSRGVERVAA